MRVRRKGLAALYVLALDGPTRRERLADLLWEGQGAANNLRVELHRLRRDLAEHGVTDAFASGVDPLTLPPGIELRTTAEGEAMEGLDGLTDRLSAWLSVQRANYTSIGVTLGATYEALVEEFLARATVPFVLVLRMPPGSDAKNIARYMAARLQLPVTEDTGSNEPALHLLQATDRPELWHRIANDDLSAWVIERKNLGDDPPLLLKLRSELPAERMSYVELPPVPWGEARHGVLAPLPFEEAARTYLASGGHANYLRQLGQLISGEQGTPPVPQRIRAAYLLEARELSDEAKLALERLSVLPGPYPPALLARLGIDVHLDELERLGWLAWGEHWSFTDVVARTVLYDALQEGRKRRYTAAAQDASLSLHAWGPDTSHAPLDAAMAEFTWTPGEPSDWTAELLEDGTRMEGSKVSMVQFGRPEATAGVELKISEAPQLLNVSGRAYIPGNPTPRLERVFELTATEGTSQTKLSPVSVRRDKGHGGNVNAWFYLEGASSLKLIATGVPIVAEFELQLFHAQTSTADPKGEIPLKTKL